MTLLDSTYDSNDELPLPLTSTPPSLSPQHLPLQVWLPTTDRSKAIIYLYLNYKRSKNLHQGEFHSLKKTSTHYCTSRSLVPIWLFRNLSLLVFQIISVHSLHDFESISRIFSIILPWRVESSFSMVSKRQMVIASPRNRRGYLNSWQSLRLGHQFFWLRFLEAYSDSKSS